MYIPTHRVLIQLKGFLTVNICIKLMHIKSKLLKSLQVSGNTRNITPLWNRRQLNPTCICRISLILNTHPTHGGV